MRKTPILVLAFALAVTASAQVRTPAAQRKADAAQADRRLEIEQRAYELRPRRRDEPLRYANISDIEVREIQQVSEKVLARTLLNISPVIEGCPCEEGPLCTDQVYVVSYANENAKGLQLSRVKNVWQVGVVQQWWFKYDALSARQSKMEWLTYRSAVGDLLREFPSCIGELVPAAKTASTQKVEAKK